MKSNVIRVAVGTFFAVGMLFYMQRILIPYQEQDAAAHNRPRGNLSDLYPRWLGARELLLNGRDPYSPEVTREIQTGFYGRPLDPSRPEDPEDQQGFAYPVYVVFLLAPTVSLPFSVVQEASVWFLLLIIAASIPMWLLFLNWRPSRAAIVLMALVTISSFTVIQGLKLQQLSLLVAALIAAAAALLSRNYFIPAGVLLALAWIKPQLAAPVSGWLFLWALSDWRNRKRYIMSFVGTVAVLLAGSEWLLPGWMARFRDAVAAYQVYTATGSVLDSLVGHSAGRVASIATILIVMFFCWRLRKAPADAPQFAWITCLALTATVVVIPTIVPYNQVLLIPGVFQAVRYWPQLMKMTFPGRAVNFLCSVIVAWPWIGACALMVFSLSVSSTQLQQYWMVPLYSSLFIPLAALTMQAFCAKQSLR